MGVFLQEFGQFNAGIPVAPNIPMVIEDILSVPFIVVFRHLRAFPSHIKYEMERS